MKWLSVALIYMSFVTLITLSVYWTNSAWPLLALIFTPNVKESKE